jgi:hypothetical protein
LERARRRGRAGVGGESVPKVTNSFAVIVRDVGYENEGEVVVVLVVSSPILAKLSKRPNSSIDRN